MARHFCGKCGHPLEPTDAFCGGCGASTGREPATVGSSRQIGAAGHGPDDQWTGFALTVEPDPVAYGAANAIEHQLAGAGIRSEPNSVRHCCIRFSDYVAASTDIAYGGRADAVVGAAIFRGLHAGRGRRAHGEFDVDASHYVFRTFRWDPLGNAIGGMSTYVAPLYSRRFRAGFGGGKQEFQTFPPSPLVNTIFVVLPGPCEGQYVFSRECGGFVANNAKPCSTWLLQGLDDPALTEDLRQMMGKDVDVIAGATFEREYLLLLQGKSNRPLGPERGTDPYFLPTLFENDPLNYRDWPGYQANPTRRVRGFGSGISERGVGKTALTMRNFDPAKYFAVVLLPFLSSSLVVATWPTVSTFGPEGDLLGTDFGMPTVARLFGYLRQLLSDPRSLASAPAAHLDYWNLANHTTVYPGSKTKQFNLAIPPLEWALASVSPA